MDYFKVNKYSSIDDNILYIAKNIIGILNDNYIGINKIFEKYQIKYNSELGLNMEVNMYLAIMFLFGIGKIQIENNKIRMVIEKHES